MSPPDPTPDPKEMLARQQKMRGELEKKEKERRGREEGEKEDLPALHEEAVKRERKEEKLQEEETAAWRAEQKGKRQALEEDRRRKEEEKREEDAKRAKREELEQKKRAYMESLAHANARTMAENRRTSTAAKLREKARSESQAFFQKQTLQAETEAKERKQKISIAGKEQRSKTDIWEREQAEKVAQELQTGLAKIDMQERMGTLPEKTTMERRRTELLTKSRSEQDSVKREAKRKRDAHSMEEREELNAIDRWLSAERQKNERTAETMREEAAERAVRVERGEEEIPND